MQWTKDKPTEEGFYRVKWSADDQPTVIQVLRLLTSSRYLDTMELGREDSYPLDRQPKALWFGPIPLPPIE